MKNKFKIWITSIVVIAISLFVIENTRQINQYEIQEDYDSSYTTAYFNNSPLNIPLSLASVPKSKMVLGDSTATKTIYVDLTNQRLYAYEGENLVYNFLVSTGKWGRTPTGTFSIWGKYRFIKMSGGSKALHTYYYLPNVPFTMFFSNNEVASSRGYAIHGTYWHENFGHPMSHGCINMQTSEAALIYSWSDPELKPDQKNGRSTSDNPGTQIIIYGDTPKS